MKIGDDHFVVAVVSIVDDDDFATGGFDDGDVSVNDEGAWYIGIYLCMRMYVLCVYVLCA